MIRMEFTILILKIWVEQKSYYQIVGPGQLLKDTEIHSDGPLSSIRTKGKHGITVHFLW